MQSYPSKLNARLIIIHLTAFWFLIFAFQTLAYLRDFNFIFSSNQYMLRVNIPQRFYADMEFISQIGNMGLLAGCIISFVVSSKNKWHWLYSIIIFAVVFFLKNFVFPTWIFYGNVLLRPGGPFKIFSLWGHIVLGIVLLAIGIWLLISKKVIGFIDARNKTTVKPQQPVKKVKAKA